MNMDLEQAIIEIREKVIKIEVLLNAEVDNLKRRTAKLEANQEWLIRTIVGAVITAVMAIIIAVK